MKYFVLHKEGRRKISGNSLYRNAEGQLCVWESEQNAEDHAEKVKTSWESWLCRPATSNDFKPQNETTRFKRSTKSWPKWKPVYVVLDSEKDSNMTKKKTVSTGMLVEVFEDYESRRFAISSKACNENEFVSEVSQALSEASSSDWKTHLVEMLPLIVDMCCKYRGYKAETVQERRELVAGDLEIPKSVL